jgi:hypothetical protein
MDVVEEEEEEIPADLSQPITFRKPTTNASSGIKSRPKTGRMRPSPVLDEDGEGDDNVSDISQSVTGTFRKAPSAGGAGSKIRNLRAAGSCTGAQPLDVAARSVATTSAEEENGATVTSLDDGATSGAAVGGNKKLKKSAKAVMLSHLADEEDE